MNKPTRKTISSLLVIVGALAMAWSLPTRFGQSAYSAISNIAAIGGLVVIVLAWLIRKKVGWARDIMLIATILMAILAVTTLLSGLSFLWVVIAGASIYLAWGLLDL